jgi:benzylsuccinate CoA-transferase BbsF subunit
MGQGVLEGVRIVDFCEFVAGPFATNTLTAMGAEVIKVESRKFMAMRMVIPDADPNSSPGFNASNQGKLSIQLNLKNPKGTELAKAIIQKSDVVLQNLRPGKIEAMGLGYDVLKQIKPDIIMVSSSGYGQQGPYSKFGGYAYTFACHSGLAELTGHPQSRPCNYGLSVDCWSAKNATVSILIALIHKQRTGKGQYVDLSQCGAIAQLNGDALMDYAMNGRIAQRQGNRDNVMAPHNCYRCKGEDQWVSIAVGNDTEWTALCDAMGQPDLKQDNRFADRFARWTNQEALDPLISGWTIQFTAQEITQTLQKAGVAAMAVLSAVMMMEDEHFKARNLAQPVMYGDRPDIAGSVSFRYGKEAVKAKRAPMFGEHNDLVYGGLLGLSKAEIDAYIEEQVIY